MQLLILSHSLFPSNHSVTTRIPLPPQDTQRRLRSDREFVREVVKQHVAVNMFPATAFQPGLVYTVNGMGGTFDVKMTRSNALTVSGAGWRCNESCAICLSISDLLGHDYRLLTLLLHYE